MSGFKENKFRNKFEEAVFTRVRETCKWCVDFATNDYWGTVEASVFHNVQTGDFHGVLSQIDTFAEPQSREIDILLEVHKPKNVRLLISCKDYTDQVKVEEVGDLEAILGAIRSISRGWLYWGLMVGRHGFQSGCEESAKRADIALVPPVTGNVAWMRYLTSEDIMERVEDAIKVFLLGETFWVNRSSYKKGDVYNGIFIATREPSGMPGETKVKNGCGQEIQMKAFVDEAISKQSNQYRIPLSRDRFFIPLFEPLRIQSMSKKGKVSASPVRSIITGPSTGIAFYRVKTASGKELIGDGQRALYITGSNGRRHELVRVDKLKPGIKIISVSEDGTKTELDEVLNVEHLKG